MKLTIQMHLESDAIFGSGISVPGGEDISIQVDEMGFPYMKGSTLKGLFREALINYLNWEGNSPEKIKEYVQRLTGESGSDEIENSKKLAFSDMTLHPEVRKIISAKAGTMPEIQSIFTYLRTFTSLENGMVKEGSLRSARCIKKGLNFYGICCCDENDKELVSTVLTMIKWAGSMRNRGFGKIEIKVV